MATKDLEDNLGVRITNFDSYKKGIVNSYSCFVKPISPDLIPIYYLFDVDGKRKLDISPKPYEDLSKLELALGYKPGRLTYYSNYYFWALTSDDFNTTESFSSFHTIVINSSFANTLKTHSNNDIFYPTDYINGIGFEIKRENTSLSLVSSFIHSLSNDEIKLIEICKSYFDCVFTTPKNKVLKQFKEEKNENRHRHFSYSCIDCINCGGFGYINGLDNKKEKCNNCIDGKIYI